MQAYVVFSEAEPMLVLSSCRSFTNPLPLHRLSSRGITKFIAHEVPLDRLQTHYGISFEVLADDLSSREDIRVLDYDGDHIFRCLSLGELGSAVMVEH
jgi:hypothetical protein